MNQQTELVNKIMQSVDRLESTDKSEMIRVLLETYLSVQQLEAIITSQRELLENYLSVEQLESLTTSQNVVI